MTQVVTLTLDQLNCIAEEDNPSSPYLWTAFLWIDETDHVQLRTPVESDDRLLLSSNLQPGQSASIPPSVGVATASPAPAGLSEEQRMSLLDVREELRAILTLLERE